MKAVIIERYGGATQLKVADIAEPYTLGPYQVKVHVRSAGLNPLDYKIRNGELRWLQPLKFPLVLGNDISGTVVAVGRAVTVFKPGDDVFGMIDVNRKPAWHGFAHPGAYAEFVVTREDTLCLKPASLSHDEAASIPLAALTAFQALKPWLAKKNPPTKRVLINGASGGVGVFAVQIAAAWGAQVTAVCRDDHHALAKRLGAQETIDYRTQPIATLTERYDVIYDVVANLRFNEVKHLLNTQAVLISNVARAATFIAPLLYPLCRRFGREKRFTHAWVRSQAADLKELAQWITEGRLHPVVTKRFALKEAEDAHRWLEAPSGGGKAVLQVT